MPIKYDDIKVVLDYLQNDVFMIKFDLTSAYLFGDIFSPNTDYLGFSWFQFGNVVYYKFTVLPFGISSACYLFTKLCCPLVNKWRGEGKILSMFLDDGFGCNKSYDSTVMIATQKTRSFELWYYTKMPQSLCGFQFKKLSFQGFY